MFVKGRLPYRCTVRIRFRAALARKTVGYRIPALLWWKRRSPVVMCRMPRSCAACWTCGCGGSRRARGRWSTSLDEPTTRPAPRRRGAAAGAAGPARRRWHVGHHYRAPPGVMAHADWITNLPASVLIVTSPPDGQDAAERESPDEECSIPTPTCRRCRWPGFLPSGLNATELTQSV